MNNYFSYPIIKAFIFIIFRFIIKKNHIHFIIILIHFIIMMDHIIVKSQVISKNYPIKTNSINIQDLLKDCFYFHYLEHWTIHQFCYYLLHRSLH